MVAGHGAGSVSSSFFDMTADQLEALADLLRRAAMQLRIIEEHELRSSVLLITKPNRRRT